MPAKNKKTINLLPREEFEHTTIGRIMKWALTTFRFIVIIVEVVVIGGFLLRFWLDVRISDLEDGILQRTALITSKKPFEDEFRTVQAKAAIYSQITNENNLSKPVIDEIAQNLPADTQLISVSRNANKISLTAATLNEQSISMFVSRLENSQRMALVTITEISTRIGSPLVEFSLDIELIDN